jgi:YVTN family beta-propeller protein
VAGWRSIVWGALWFCALSTLAPGHASSLFVVNQDDATVSVIDTSVDALAANIPVAFAPAAIASDRDGKWLYVTHPERGEVFWHRRRR